MQVIQYSGKLLTITKNISRLSMFRAQALFSTVLLTVYSFS